MLISIIVPVYNASATLARCVDSLLRQTCECTEIILVDDGSTDDSPAMADRYEEQNPGRIRVLHKENGGLMRAWMDGVKISTGAYLCFVDSDDWIDREMIGQMAGQLKQHEGIPSPGQIVCCGYLIEYPSGASRAVGHQLDAGVYEGSRLQDELKRNLLGHERRHVILSRCMKLISRELITDNLRFLNPSIRIGEDVNIMVPALLDAERVVLMQEPYYHYLFVVASMSHGYDPHMYDDFAELRNCLHTILLDKYGDRADLSPADREFCYLFLTALKNEIRRTDGPHAARKAIARIRTLCRGESGIVLPVLNQEPVTDPANRLMAMICRRPSAVRILFIRLIFRLYEVLRP